MLLVESALRSPSESSSFCDSTPNLLTTLSPSVKPPPFELPTIYKDSNSTVPLIFVLSPGSDPMNALQKFALVKKKEAKPVSLGQGQGPKAEAAIAEA